MILHTLSIPSPIGALRLLATDDALVAVLLPAHHGAPTLEARPASAHPVLERARGQLEEYFAGRRTAFDLPLRLDGTEFQRAVWTALQAIPFGETRSYAELARAIGRPTAVRAVGAANGRNPLSIVVPCHRVIGTGGALTGYAGGLERKRWLLAHEVLSLPAARPSSQRSVEAAALLRGHDRAEARALQHPAGGARLLAGRVACHPGSLARAVKSPPRNRRIP